MKLRQMLPAARLELLEPRAQRPSYRLLLQLAVARIQDAHNQATNSHRSWSVDDITLSTTSGQEEYALNVSSVGKILDVVYSDPLNVEGTERQIPFYDFNDLVGDYRNWNGASGIAFYYRQGQLYAKVRPIPQDEKDYRISYVVGNVTDTLALDDEPFLSAHHHYFVAGIALDALPAAVWFDEDDEKGMKRNEARRNSLERSLARRVEEYYRQFKLGISGLTIPRVTDRYEAYPIE